MAPFLGDLAPFLGDWIQREKPSVKITTTTAKHAQTQCPISSKLSIAWKISCEIFDLDPILLTFNAARNFNMLFGVLTAYLGYFYAQVTLVRLTGF